MMVLGVDVIAAQLQQMHQCLQDRPPHRWLDLQAQGAQSD